MKKNYVLIDYENVQPDALAGLDQEHFVVIVFLGANQSKVTFELVSVLHSMGDRALYVQIAGSGKNALDFHISYYLGQLAAKEPDAYFHIVSKDTDFDLLIDHMKSKKIAVGRVKSIGDIPLLKPLPKTLGDRVSLVTANLAKNGAARPGTVKTLSSTINAMFRKTLSESEIAGIVDELRKKGAVVLNQTKVSYVLPA
jgi:hypothetical protein